MVKFIPEPFQTSIYQLCMKNIITILFFLSGYLCSCDRREKEKDTGGWINGSENEKFKTVEKHLRGLDIAMVETGYRYTELYWAGRDQNWDYAVYQLDKIRTTIEYAVERRPKRASSAQAFLQNSIPVMREAIGKKDTAIFNQNFIILQAACQSCHVAEKVPFIHSAIPEYRLSPVKYTKQ
jgi:hypothetical protein